MEAWTWDKLRGGIKILDFLLIIAERKKKPQASHQPDAAWREVSDGMRQPSQNPYPSEKAIVWQLEKTSSNTGARPGRWHNFRQ